MTTYAELASNGDGSIRLTVPHSGRPDIEAVTFCHFSPLSVVTCTSPSSLPAQIRPSRFGDSAMANTVPYVSTPVLSPVMGPPAHFCLDLSLRVRSGLMACQFCP